MAYNPKWRSLASLVAWLEKRPPRATYCYDDNGKCLLAQWFKFCGNRKVLLGNILVVFADGITHELPESFQFTAMTRPHNFGAALKRARKGLADQSITKG